MCKIWLLSSWVYFPILLPSRLWGLHQWWKFWMNIYIIQKPSSWTIVRASSCRSSEWSYPNSSTCNRSCRSFGPFSSFNLRLMSGLQTGAEEFLACFYYPNPPAFKNVRTTDRRWRSCCLLLYVLPWSPYLQECQDYTSCRNSGPSTSIGHSSLRPTAHFPCKITWTICQFNNIWACTLLDARSEFKEEFRSGSMIPVNHTVNNIIKVVKITVQSL